jgi:DNA-binding NarL/FixJ family response regulator
MTVDRSIRVIVDALVAVLSSEPDVGVVGAVNSNADARGLLDVQADVALMECVVGDGTGIEAVHLIKGRQPAATIVMVAAIADDDTILKTIQAGADGYLTKDQPLDEVAAAVRATNAHEILPPRAVIVEIALRVADSRGRGTERPLTEPLTPRELDVLHLLVEGLGSPTICERPALAPNTLRTHMQNIMAELGTHSRLETVAFALRNVLVAASHLEARHPLG